MSKTLPSGAPSPIDSALVSRVFFMTCAALLAGCGGGADSSTPAASTAVSSAKPASSPAAAPAPAPAPPAAPPPAPTLSHWFQGGVSGKSMAWVGDSTTWQIPPSGAGAYLTATYQQTGEPLAGVSVLYFGANGNTLANFLNNQPGGFGLSSIVAAAPNLIVFSYGINDVRQGATSAAQLQVMLVAAVNQLEAALPTTDIILRLPNSFLSVDIGNNGYVVPNSAAQSYSDALATAYRALAATWPNVVLYDSRKALFSDTSLPSSVLMSDQIHPSLLGYEDIIDQIVAIATPPSP